MTSSLQRQLVAILAAVGLMVAGMRGADLAPAKAATGKVMAKFAQGSPVIASGFIYGDPSRLVTCLHVVAGATEITVTVGRIACPATVDRVWRDADLALLKLARPAEGGALARAVGDPAGGSRLSALGFPLGSPVVRSTTGELRQVGGQTLGDLIGNANLRSEIARNGFPSLQAPVLDMQLPITPGMSGGPVLDEQGALVGICNGGLENGAGELTWAIAASRLDQLMTSNDRNAGTVRGASKSLFSAETQAAPGAALVVAGRSFTKLRTRSLSEFTRYTDDLLGLTQLAAQFTPMQPYSWKFDVYRDFDHGATLVVPAGLTAREEDGVTVIASPQSETEMRVEYHTGLADVARQQQVTVAFEESIRSLHPDVYWAVHPQWSYPQPVFFPNGLTVRRKAAVGNHPNFALPLPPKALFETFAIMQDRLLCVAVIDANYPLVYQSPPPAIAWGQMVLAVQLASFTQMSQ